MTAWLASGSEWEGFFLGLRFLVSAIEAIADGGATGLLLLLGAALAVIGIGWAWNNRG